MVDIFRLILSFVLSFFLFTLGLGLNLFLSLILFFNLEVPLSLLLVRPTPVSHLIRGQESLHVFAIQKLADRTPQTDRTALAIERTRSESQRLDLIIPSGSCGGRAECSSSSGVDVIGYESLSCAVQAEWVFCIVGDGLVRWVVAAH